MAGLGAEGIEAGTRERVTDAVDMTCPSKGYAVKAGRLAKVK